MRKKCTVYVALSLLAAFLLCGCGTPMYELTKDEEELIIQYSAYAVGRFNTYQKDGVTYYRKEQYETPAAVVTPDLDIGSIIDSAGESTIVPAENTSLGSTIRFGDVIGGGDGLFVSYRGFELTDNYQEGNYFSIGAKKPGNQLFVAKFGIRNVSGQDVSINVLEKNPVFRLSLDGGTTWLSQEPTLLVYDFSTFYGTLKDLEEIQCVLLFEVPADKSINESSVTYSVVQNGTTYPVY